MATMYATYKDNNNNLNQVSLTTTAKNDLIYSVLDIGGQFGYYAWRDANTTDRVVIKRLNLLTGELYTFTSSGNEYITISGAIDPLMLCLTRDGNTLYIASAGSKDIYSFTTVQGTATPATTITSISTGKFIYAMKINKSGHLTTISKDNIINQFDTANANAQVGTANKDWTSTFSTMNNDSVYLNIPFYFSYEGGTEYILLPLWNTSQKCWQIRRLSQTSFSYGSFNYFYPNAYKPFATTNAHRYGADMLTDIYGDVWLSHTSYNGIASDTSTVTGNITNAVFSRISNPIGTLYISWTTSGSLTTFVIKETNSGGATITTIVKESINTAFSIELNDKHIDMLITINNLNGNGTATVTSISASEVLKIQAGSKSDFTRPIETTNYFFTSTSPYINTISSYAFASNVNISSYLKVAYWLSDAGSPNKWTLKIKTPDDTVIYEDAGILSNIPARAISNNYISASLNLVATFTETYIDCYFSVKEIKEFTGGSVLFEDTGDYNTDTNKNLCLINNLGADSTGAIYYSYVADLSQTEVNGKIYRYRSDGGASTVTASNLETYLSRSYCLTNRNDMLAYDLSTDGCAGR